MKRQYWPQLVSVLALIPTLGCLLHAQVNVSREKRLEVFTKEYNKAGELWNHKEYRKAITIFEELESNPSLSDIIIHSDMLYNIACGYSLIHESDKAVAALQSAIDAGYNDVQHIDGDNDLDYIRKDVRFQTIREKVRRSSMIWDNPVFRTDYRPDLSRTEKVAGLSRLWSEVKYNFAFVDRLVEINWDSLYSAYLPLVEQTSSTAEYYRLLTKLCTLLHDGHTDIRLPKELQSHDSFIPGMQICNVHDTIAVTSADDGSRMRGIVPGLRITKIEGQPVLEYAQREIYPFISASTSQGLRLMSCLHNRLMAGPEGSSVQVEFSDSTGTTFSRTLVRSMQSTASTPQPLIVFKALPGNIGYVALNTFNDSRIVAQFDSLFPEIEKTSALVLDVRTNGGGNNAWAHILGYFTDKPFASSQWQTRQYCPTYRAWGRGAQWLSQDGWNYQPNGKRLYKKPVALLIGPRTFSAAEDFCVAFDFMHRGPLVGESTAGSTGQPLSFDLPGGGSARVCTKHDRYPDGREFVGVGVRPTIEVQSTLKDILSEYDKPLRSAVEYLATQLK